MVALVGALPLAVRHRFEGVWIPSTSMVPTLLVGDYVLIDKSAHWPARGDVVVFTDPNDSNEILVKRIVGLGGEEITVQGHDVYINCEPQQDACTPVVQPYADFSDEVRATKDVDRLENPSGAVLVKSGSRHAGGESAAWAPVSEPRIIGRPVWV